MSKLAVIVLGNRNSGKSTTWNELFGRTVRTGTDSRALKLTNDVTVPVFLVSGSPQERKKYIEDIIGDATPQLLLCSMQYNEEARGTVSYLAENGYKLFVHWLNPGFGDDAAMPDVLGFMPFLLYQGAVICVRDGKRDPSSRVREIREYLIGWASSRRVH